MVITRILPRFVVIASLLLAAATTAIAAEPLKPGKYTVVLVKEWGDPKDFGPERIDLLQGILTKDSEAKLTLRVVEGIHTLLKLSLVAEGGDASGFQVQGYRGETDLIESVGAAYVRNNGKVTEVKGTLKNVGTPEKCHFIIRSQE